jgi:predicted phage terminase large subunit-like protein
MGDFPVLKPLVHCMSCSSDQSLTAFRKLSDDPLTYVDFCGSCEAAYGTLSLYSKYAGTPAVTRRARDIIVSGKDSMAPKLEEKAVNYREERTREFARRELSRKYFLYYVKQFNPTYLAGWVHKDIARRLEQFIRDVENGLSPRLMLFMPPRHGKSTLASIEFPGWSLGRHADWEIISASYASSLPIGFSRTIKDRLDDPDYHAIFPDTKLRSDARGVEEWHTTKRGRYRAAGVEGGITGTGAHVLIIDDPIKDYQEAQSPKVRENAYNWYTSTARTRLAPGGGVLLIQTRWHDGDLSGMLLADKQALVEANVDPDEIDDWQVVSYPALAEYDEYLFPDRTIQVSPDQVPEGAIKLRGKEEALHPERYSALELRRIRNTMPSVQWNALFQQNPVPETGEYFTKDMFRGYSTLPGAEEEYAYFSAWDLAIGEKAQNDWTVGTICAYHYTGAIYVLDMIRGRMNMHGIISSMIAMARKWPHMQVLGIEQGQIYKTMAPLLNEAMLFHKVRFSLTEELKPVTDKLMRARPLQQKMQMGLVHFPTAQPWVSLVERELLRFPSGTHDDIVDSLAWLIRMSMVISPPKPQSARALGRKPQSWKSQLTVSSGDKSFMTA